LVAVGQTREEWLEEIAAHVSTGSAREPARDSVGPGAETAPDTFKRFLREEMGPVLRGLGFKGSGSTFRLPAGEFEGGLKFQGSRWNHRAMVTFWVDAWAGYTPTGAGFWDERVGQLVPPVTGEWVVPAHGRTDRLLEDLRTVVGHYARHALLAATDNPGFPPDGRAWPRAFPELPRPRAPRTFEERTRRPPSTEEAFALASNADLHDPQYVDRFAAMWICCVGAPDDPRCAPILLRYVDNDPAPMSRARAATLLGFVACDPAVVLPRLRAVASEDCVLTVRAQARYAIRLIENPPEA
jgi:hypothetical protein